MKLRPPRSLLIIFIGLSIFTAGIPIIAGKGGQWDKWALINANSPDPILSNRSPNTTRDYYFPQTNLWPKDSIAYGIALAGVIALGAYFYLNKRMREFKRIYWFYFSLPFIWAAVTFWNGFDYSQCHAPAYTACHNPNKVLLYVLSGFFSATLLPVLVYKWIQRRIRNIK